MSRPADVTQRKSEHRVPIPFHVASLTLDLVPPVLACAVAWILVNRVFRGPVVLTATVASLLLFVLVVYIQWTSLRARRATRGMRALGVELGDTRGGGTQRGRLGMRSAYFGVVFVAIFLETVARSLTTDGRIPGMGLLGLVVLVDILTLAFSPNRVALHDLVLGFTVRWSHGGIDEGANTSPTAPRVRSEVAGTGGRSVLTKSPVPVIALIVVPGLVAGGLGGYFGLGWLMIVGLGWLLLGVVVARLAGVGRSVAR